jgi:hypothetical protein
MNDIRQQLLNLAYAKEQEYIFKCSAREFDCLICLIEDGAITTFEELAEYGVE